MSDVPVLIVGGGPVGLTASILLSREGIRSLLVEKHPGTAILPKARGINARTMEMYRQLGLDAAIRAAGPQMAMGLIVWVESLAGREIERRAPGRGSAKNMAVTPVTNCLCAQDDFEPVLRRAAEAAAPDGLRFSTELVWARVEGDGLVAVLANRETGQEETVHARFLIAAEGAQSRMRRQIGAAMVGEHDVYDSINVLFHADLRRWVEDRPAALYFVEQPEFRATFLTINGTDRWGFLVHSLSHYGFTAADFTPERCIAMIRAAAGVPDLAIEVRAVSGWKASATVADRYRDGPIFLAGDAAHEVPPTGAFGLNTGVQDVQNLVWKLAAVLRGEAAPALLDSYQQERQPLATLIARTTLENAASMGRMARQTGVTLARSQYLNEQGLIFGARYDGMAVIPDTSPPELADPVTEYVPSAHPGCRAPHMALRRGDATISTIDLFGSGFVLLAGPGGGAWREVARRQAAPAVAAYVLGEDVVDADGAWEALYGVGADGAVLVRPDGYVAWRAPSPPADPVAALAGAIDRLLGRRASVTRPVAALAS